MACHAQQSPDSGLTENEVEGIQDHRMDPGEPPSEGFQERTPEFILEPHSEVMYCYFGRYSGPDVGATYYEWFQDPTYGHHFMTLAVSDDTLIADGEMVDCTDPEQFVMGIMPPLLQGTELVEAPNGRMVLPDGVAIQLVSGQRWALQSHYVNPTDNPLLLQDAINVVTVPAEEVETWASTYVANSSQFDLPPGRHAMDVTCEWPATVNLINMMGHMHTNGRSINIQHGHDGVWDLLFEVEEWEPSYVYGPILRGFEEGEAVIEAGDTVQVHCAYDNVTDETLRFPDEMCVGAGIAWPMTAPFQCDVPVTMSTW